jgi:hypothetical protein
MKLGIITSAVFASFSAACIASGVMPTDDTSTTSTSTVATGQASMVNHQCASCHADDMSGLTTAVSGTQTYGSNITMDTATGIGSWTDDQIIGSIRLGKDTKNGRVLCESMPRYALSDSEVVAEVLYLRSLAPISHSIPASTCATIDAGVGTDPGATDDAGATTDPDSSSGGGACPGYADPSTKAACHSCSGGTCQSNGCFGGYYCNTSTTKCVPKPSSC